VLALVLVAALARQDIVEIRHDRWPRHTDVLGWTANGEVVVRRTACGVQDDSDVPYCSVTLTVAGRRGTRVERLLRIRGEAGAPHLDLPYATATRFIHAEDRALGALGPLEAGAATTTPDDLRLLRYEAGDSRRLALLRGRRWLKVLWSVRMESDQFIRRARIVRVDEAPSGADVAVVVRLDLAEDDYYWDEQDVVVVPAAHGGPRRGTSRRDDRARPRRWTSYRRRSTGPGPGRARGDSGGPARRQPVASSHVVGKQTGSGSLRAVSRASGTPAQPPNPAAELNGSRSAWSPRSSPWRRQLPRT